MPLLLGLAAGPLLPTAAAAWQGSMQVQADAHVDGAPLSALSDDDIWQRVQPRPGRNLGYLFAEVRTTASQGPWALSLLARHRALLTASEGALGLARAVEGGNAAARDASYLVRADYLRFVGYGAELARRFALGDRWQLDIALQGLALTRLDSLRLDGQASYTASTETYGADLAGQRANDHLVFPFQQPFSARGSAWLTHGRLQWQGERWDGAVAWQDAGWLLWQGLPQQQLRLNSDIQGTDANGYAVYQPLVTGQNRQDRYRRGLAPLMRWQAGWRDDHGARWHGQLEHVPGFGWLPRVGWERPWGDFQLGAALRLHERRLDTTLGWRGLQLQLGSDRLRDPHSLQVGLSWQAALR